MIFSNLLVICTMSIQGKGLTRGTSHDEMVSPSPTRIHTLARTNSGAARLLTLGPFPSRRSRRLASPGSSPAPPLATSSALAPSLAARAPASSETVCTSDGLLESSDVERVAREAGRSSGETGISQVELLARSIWDLPAASYPSIVEFSSWQSQCAYAMDTDDRCVRMASEVLPGLSLVSRSHLRVHSYPCEQCVNTTGSLSRMATLSTHCVHDA